MKHRLPLLVLMLLLLFPAGATDASAVVANNTTKHYMPQAITTTPMTPLAGVTTSGNVTYAFSADVTGDGVPEIVTVEHGSTDRYVNVYFLNGTLLTSITMSSEPISVEVGDISVAPGNEIITVFADSTGTYLEAFYVNATAIGTVQLETASATEAEIAVGTNYIFVVFTDPTHTFISGLEKSLTLIGTQSESGRNFERVVKGDVNVINVNGIAYYATIGYDSISSSKVLSVDIIDGNFAKASAFGNDIIIRANGRIYYLQASLDTTTMTYTVIVDNVGAYTSVGAAYEIAHQQFLVSDGSTIVFFYYDVTNNARVNATTTVSYNVYAFESVDLNADGTAELYAITAGAIYEIATDTTAGTVTATEAVSYGTSIQNFYEVDLRDVTGDGYPDMLIIGVPIVIIASGSTPSVYATISVSVNEYAIGKNGIYVLDTYDNVHLYAFNGTEIVSVTPEIIGLDSGYTNIQTVYPSGYEALFMKTQNGFIALNGTTLLPIRYEHASATMRFLVEPNYLIYVSSGSLNIDTITLDQVAPTVNLSTDRTFYDPMRNVTLNITASDNVYLYKLTVTIYNTSGALLTRTFDVYAANFFHSLEFNLTAFGIITPGRYNITATVSDGSCLIGNALISIFVDDGKAPQIEYIGDTVFNVPLDSIIYVPFNVTDAAPVNVTIYYSYDGQNRSEADYIIEGTIFNASITVSAYGYLHVKIVVTDAVGHQSTLMVVLIIDDGNAPSITINGPDSNVEVQTVVNYLVTVEDVTLKNVVITVYKPDGTVCETVEIAKLNESTRNVTFKLTVLGTRNVDVFAIDLAGHTSIDTVAVTAVDTQAPQLVENSVSYPKYVNVNDTFSLAFEVTDNYYQNVSVKIYFNLINGGSYLVFDGSVPTNVSTTVSIVIPVYGMGYFSFVLADGSNNTNTIDVPGMFTIFVDDGNAPSITITTSADSAEVYSSVNVSVNVSDITLQNVTICVQTLNAINGSKAVVYNETFTASDGSFSYNFTINLKIVGNYTICIYAVDALAHEAMSSKTVVSYDDIAPSITITNVPQETVDVGQQVQFDVYITDNYMIDEDSIQVSINNETMSFSIAESNNTYVHLIVTYTPEAPGDYTISVSVSDVSGNTNNTAASFHVEDLTPPSVSVKVPSSVEVLTSVIIQVTATDNYEIGSVKIFYSRDNSSRQELNVQQVDDTTRSASYTPDELGTLYIKVSVSDLAGHEVDKYASVTVYDDVAPKIEAVDIPGEVSNGQEFTIGVKASDNYKVDHVEIYVSYDNATREKLDVKYENDIRTASYTPEQTGTLYIKVVVYDAAGNETTGYYTVNVITNRRAVGLGTILIIILIALIAAIIKLRRR